MANPLIDSDPSEHAVPRRARLRPPGWLREPLLHFVVLGGLLFAVDHLVVRSAEDPHTIVVGADVDKEARETFKAARGHEPNVEELEALRRVWLDNEVLYREGLSLQVDKGDTAIRERVIFKALSVVDSNVRVPTVDDKTLRAWFDDHRSKYDEPARFDFQEAALSGTPTEAEVREFVTALNGGTPGDAKAGLRVFKARPLGTLTASYGPDFGKALQAATLNTWQALPTRDGWRAIRLDAVVPAKPASFEALRGMVLHDWIDATASAQRSAVVRALSKKYKVRYEAAAEGTAK